MSSEEKYIDRRSARYFETLAQVEDFQLDRFREFFDAFMRFRSSWGEWDAWDPPLRACLAEGVDSMSTAMITTSGACQLTATFFGEPGDDLLTETGELTAAAQGTLDRIRRYRDRMAETWDVSHLGILPPRGYYLDSVVFELFIGRRALGRERFEVFKTKTEELSRLLKNQTATAQVATDLDF
jgi:hypothetical protein